MARGIISENLKKRIKDLNREGYQSFKIAEMLNLPEAIVVKVLKPKA